MLPRRLFLDSMLGDFEKEDRMKCDIYEKDNIINVEMDIPGFDKKDIKVEIHKGTLIITAEKKEEEITTDDKKYLRRERSFYGKYQRSFYLGDVEEEKIDAKFSDGLLKIAIPKTDVEKNKKQKKIK